MRFARIIVLVLVVLFIIIQFIRPSRNHSTQILTTDISRVLLTPDTILALLRKACYDCHTNNTDYPWYSGVQPIGWLLAYHIKRAKNQLNFSDFGAYPRRRQLSKLDGICNSINDNVMPLPSYRFMHKYARLNKNEKASLVRWATAMEDSLSSP